MKPGPAGLLAWAARGECAAWLVALAAVAILLALGQYREPRSRFSALRRDLRGPRGAAGRPVDCAGVEWLLVAPRPLPRASRRRLRSPGRCRAPGLSAPAGRLPRQRDLPGPDAAADARACARVPPRHDSRLIVTLLLLLPIAFAYRIRANQEQPLLMFLLAALYGIERSRASLRWAVLSTAGLAGLFLVKGVFVVVAVAAAAVWLVVRQWVWPDRPIRLRPWLSLAIGVACLSAFYLAYDAAYTRVTGEQFFWWYFSRQFGVANASSAAHPVAGALVQPRMVQRANRLVCRAVDRHRGDRPLAERRQAEARARRARSGSRS